MGLTVSCQPKYLGYDHFVKLVQNANNYIIRDTNVWEEDEKECLIQFFSTIQSCLQNNLYGQINKQLPWYTGYEQPGGWVDNERIKDFVQSVRLAVPKTLKAREIYAYTVNPIKNSSSGGIIGFQEDFSNASPQTQVQLSHLYALIAFLWIMYEDGYNAARYFYKSDIFHYLCQNCQHHSQIGEIPDSIVNTARVDALSRAIEKIYFTGKSGMIPAGCLVLPTCEFRVLRGTLKGFDGHNLPLKVPINSGEPYYTVSPIRIETINDQLDQEPTPLEPLTPIAPKHFTRSDHVENIQNNISDLIRKLRQVQGPEKCGHCLEQGAAGKHIAESIDYKEKPKPHEEKKKCHRKTKPVEKEKEKVCEGHCTKFSHSHLDKFVEHIQGQDELSQKVEEYLTETKKTHPRRDGRSTNEYLEEILDKVNLLFKFLKEHRINSAHLSFDKRNE
jgi:hypothetical protein